MGPSVLRYCGSSTKCRRAALLSHFGETLWQRPALCCDCCDLALGVGQGKVLAPGAEQGKVLVPGAGQGKVPASGAGQGRIRHEDLPLYSLLPAHPYGSSPAPAVVIASTASAGEAASRGLPPLGARLNGGVGSGCGRGMLKRRRLAAPLLHSSQGDLDEASGAASYVLQPSVSSTVPPAHACHGALDLLETRPAGLASTPAHATLRPTSPTTGQLDRLPPRAAERQAALMRGMSSSPLMLAPLRRVCANAHPISSDCGTGEGEWSTNADTIRRVGGGKPKGPRPVDTAASRFAAASKPFKAPRLA